MTQIISKAVLCVASLALLGSLARGQDIPAVTSAPPMQGFQLPITAGTLSYALTLSGRLRTGYYAADARTWGTTASGDVAYLSRSESRPFNMAYSGGYVHNSDNEPSSAFQNLSLGQSIITQAWKFSVSDSVSYLPESASSGFSGIPGVGDVGVTNPSAPPQDILTRDSQRVSNSATGSVQRQLTGRTTLQGQGNFIIQRFLGASDGFDSDQTGGQGELVHHIDALTSVKGNYTFVHSTFPGQSISFTAQKITAGYTKQLTRKLNIYASLGPEVVSNNAPGSAGASVNFAGNAGAAYATRQYDLALTFFRGVRTGSGVVQGTLTTTVNATANRRIGEFFNLAASGGYARNSSIEVLTDSPFTFQTYTGDLQASRAVARNLNVFVSYVIQDQQAPQISNTIDAFSGRSQTVAFGITYSPRPIHVGH